MIEIRNSETLQRWLLESGHLAPLWDRPRFVFDADEFSRELAGVRAQYPQFSDDEAEARASLRIIGKEEGRGRSRTATAVAGPRAGARGWTRRERLLLVGLLILAALIALLLAVPRAHAQSVPAGSRAQDLAAEAGFERLRFYNHLLAARGLPSTPRAGLFGLARGPYRADQGLAGGQPGGIIIQLANSGSVLATTPAGLLQFNCSAGMSCSFAAGSGSNPPTFTLTSTGGGGSGCIPPGSTANALLFDAGSGTCSDVAKFTWNNGTSTLSLASGGTFDPTAGTVKVPGTSGQLLFNNGGVLGAEDPVVSGPDARGAAQTKSPVAGLAGIDYGTGCAGSPCVQEAKVDASGNQFVNVTNTVPVSGTFWQSTQPVSLASLPALAAGANTIGAVTQASGPWTVNQTQIGGTNLVADPCQTAAKTSLAINQASSSLTTIISGVSAKHTYVCSIFLISATAQNVNIVAGTGTNCGTTVHVGFFGGTTAATGPNLAANTGFTLGNGRGVVAGGTDTAADNICYTSSSNGQVSGVLTYVQQ